MKIELPKDKAPAKRTEVHFKFDLKFESVIDLQALYENLVDYTSEESSEPTNTKELVEFLNLVDFFNPKSSCYNYTLDLIFDSDSEIESVDVEVV